MMFRDWWDDLETSRPSRLLDQHFGTGLRMDDLLNSMSLRNSRYYRPWRTVTGTTASSAAGPLARQDSGSTIANDKEKFQVILDVQQFSPSELTVKITNNSIVVEGKHEEKQDEHGFISRHFVRRYMLPADNDVNDVVSSLSSDGILTVTAPKRTQKPAAVDRVVPITQTGPAKSTVTESAAASSSSSTCQPTVEHPPN